jgi:hypothetical protein
VPALTCSSHLYHTYQSRRRPDAVRAGRREVDAARGNSGEVEEIANGEDQELFVAADRGAREKSYKGGGRWRRWHGP